MQSHSFLSLCDQCLSIFEIWFADFFISPWLSFVKSLSIDMCTIVFISGKIANNARKVQWKQKDSKDDALIIFISRFCSNGSVNGPGHE